MTKVLKTFFLLLLSGTCSLSINAQSNLSLTGEIVDAKGARLSGVDVSKWANFSYTESKTDSNGVFLFENCDSSRVNRIRPYNYNEYRNGVTSHDLYLIARHILGLQPFTDPYSVVASDVDLSKTTSANDLAIIRNLILLSIDTFQVAPSWRFIDPYHPFRDTVLALVDSFPEEYRIRPGLADTILQLDFIGVKLGDVNHNHRVDLLLELDDRAAQKSQFFETQQSDQHTTIALLGDAGQFAFSTNSAVTDFAIDGLEPWMYDVQRRTENTYVCSYINPYGKSIKLTLTGNEPLEIQLSRTLADFRNEYYLNTADNNALAYGIEFKAQNAPALTAFPQPMLNQVTIVGLLPNTTSILVYNANGQLIEERQISPIQDQVTMLTSDWRAGMYFLKATDGHSVQTIKLIK